MFSKTLPIFLLTMASTPLLASPVLNPDNGHYYELHTFKDDWRLNWNEAKQFAESLTFQGGQGHLATVTSQSEDDFLWNVLGAQGVFLGAFDTSTKNTETGLWQHNAWQWVTGEAFTYTNWLEGEPNHWQDDSSDTPDNEDYLMSWWTAGAGGQRWNDTNIDSSYLIGGAITYSTRGFVVEYTPMHAPLPASAWMFLSGLAYVLGRKKCFA